MTTAMKTAGWVVASAAVLWVLFAPGRGLLHQGPWAATGVLLMAAGAWKQARSDGWRPEAVETKAK